MSRRPQSSRRVERLPLDLAAVAALDVVTVAALLVPAVRATPIRAVLGLPFLLVLPGYAVVSALFPENRLAVAPDESASETGPSASGTAASDPGVFLRHELDGFERLGLSVGASIVVVCTLALGLDRSAVGLGTATLVPTVGAFTLGVAAIAVLRREELSPDERFGGALGAELGATRLGGGSVGARFAGVRDELLNPDTKVDAALNVLVVVSLLVAAGGTAFAVTSESRGEGDTELYLLSENDDGALVADGYPDTLAEARQNPLVVGLENREGEATDYTVVAELHRVTGPPNETTVTAERELARYGVRVAAGGSWQTRHVPRERLSGDRLRLVYLLYRGDPPADPSVANAAREVHVWLNGSRSAGGGAVGNATAGTTTAANATANASALDSPGLLGRWS
ncbi:DUF1616 domain-containing protein [Halorussus salinus]|uniref:DUF1616 domain-containing protein n=1 Tax=Halorussus salinus TaxID=1364935 RepID=UPI001092488A|nr:DUF1616 domain-containing protein [Halorussus salinus]